jgi:hypothetical protein
MWLAQNTHKISVSSYPKSHTWEEGGRQDKRHAGLPTDISMKSFRDV